MKTKKENNNQHMIDRFAALSAWFKKHPNAPALNQWSCDYFYVTLPKTESKEELAKLVKGIGSCRKQVSMDESDFEFIVEVGSANHGARLKFITSRANVCEKKVVGFKSVPAQVIPECVIPAREEEIVEWSCPDSILAKVASSK